MKQQGRTRKALLAAAFNYGQFGIAVASAFFVTPLILRTIGPRQYGIWLSSGEIIGYLLLLDFGVFAILPWLIARADGQKDYSRIRRLLSQSSAIALSLVAFLLLGVFTFWKGLPVLLHLRADDWQALAGPLALLVILSAVNLPLNVFNALLGGLQDIGFTGGLGLAKTVLGPIITVALLWSGHGLYALAIGTAFLTPLCGVAAFFRARITLTDLLRGWPAPTWRETWRFFQESIGAWLSGVGVQLMERSSAIVLAFMGDPATVPVLVCTSRFPQILTQMVWLIPDSALIGFAQLSGENNSSRLREVALSIIRVNIVLAAGAACVVLALNPSFVKIWVGGNFFGGLLLNLLVAAEIISGSLVHSLATLVAVHGNRLQIGLVTLLQGAIYLVLALVLTRRFSLHGLLAADLLAPLFSTIPVSAYLLCRALDLSLARLAAELALLLILQAGPCLLVAWAYGYWRGQHAPFLELAAVGVMIAYGYLRMMARHIASFPLPLQATVWLQRLRVI